MSRQRRATSKRRREWPVVRDAVYLRDGQRCAMCGGYIHFGDLEVHHRKPRSQGGQDDMANLIALHGGFSITSCHAKVHAHPRASYRHGFLVPSFADPQEWPVLRFSAYWEQPCKRSWVPVDGPADGQVEVPDAG